MCSAAARGKKPVFLVSVRGCACARPRCAQALWGFEGVRGLLPVAASSQPAS